MLAPVLHAADLKLMHSVNNFNNTSYAFGYFIAKSSLTWLTFVISTVVVKNKAKTKEMSNAAGIVRCHIIK